MQTIFPILRYDDARAAIRWLCSAFGFVELFSVPATGDLVRHAQLALGSNVVMLGTHRPGEPRIEPALYVFVDDLDAHFERARAAGAAVDGTPIHTDFDARQYHARDSEGHSWTFGTYRPDLRPAAER